MSASASLSIALPCAVISRLIYPTSDFNSFTSYRKERTSSCTWPSVKFTSSNLLSTSAKPSATRAASFSIVSTFFSFAISILVYHTCMERKQFERLVEKGYERLPQWVREKIKNVALLVEDEPSKEDREAEGLGDDETLLGLYKGIPLSARGGEYGVGMPMPDTITLYQVPIEEAAEEDGLPVAQVIAETIWHEFAHHFGMDEHEVRRREGERENEV